MNRLLLATLVFSLAGLRLAAGALSQGQIGSAAAVKGSPMRKMEKEPVGKIISSGQPVFKNDHVTTDSQSRLQVLLRDQTVFTLGPDSDMVLDQFDFDEKTQAGKVTATIKKGVFRFVTGKIASAQPSAMKVKLPVGTIGIRGTIVAGIVKGNMCAAMLGGPGAGNNANAKVGAFELSNVKGEATLVKDSGKGSMIVGNAAPTPAGVLPASVVGEINAGLSVKPAAGSGGESEGSQGASNSGTAPAEDSDSGSGEPSVAEQSGDQAASAQGNAGETEGANALSQELATTSTQGSQDNVKLTAGFADGLAKWDDVRARSSPVDGFYFSNHNYINCVGCASGSSPGFEPVGALQLYVSFASRCIGGTGPRSGGNGPNSFIHLHGVYTNNQGDTVEQRINQISFESLGGSAQFSLTPLLQSATCNGLACANGDSFAGTTVDLNNRGGVPAAEAVGNLQYSNTAGKSATGSLVSPFGEYPSGSAF